MKLINILHFNYITTLDRRYSFDFEEISVLVDKNDKFLERHPKLDKISTKDYNFIPGEKIFITSDCKVPRFKIAQFKENNDISVIRDPDKADKIFISNDFLNKLISYSWGKHVVSASAFIEFLKNNYSEDDLLAFDFQKLEEYKYISLSSHAYSNAQNGWNVLIKFKTALEDALTNYVYTCNDLKLLEVYNNYRDKIYDQKDLINLIAKDFTAINEEMYDNLSAMLSSTDNSNHALAMEIVANCDYTQSFHYLYMLFFKYSGVINLRPEKNHVNFKSLLEALNYRVRDNRPYFDNFIKLMFENDSATKENLEKILNFVSEEINRGDYGLFMEIKNSKNFKYQNLIFTEELNKLIEERKIEEEVENV